MKQVKMQCLKNKTFVKVENECVNSVLLLTSTGARYMIDTEAKGYSLYGPALYRITNEEYEEMTTKR